MITSFTFNGVSCESLGLTYAPDNKDMYVWSPTTRNIHEQQFEGHHGGYFFGASCKWKDFVLRCFYAQKCEDTEEFDVMNGFFTQLYRVFEVGTTGQLTFSNRPWIYYDATIVNVDASQIRGTKGGFVIITARAYYPYGLCSQLDLPNTSDKFYNDMKNNSSMMHNTISFFPVKYTGLNLQHNNGQSFFLFNPGTVTADVAVKVKAEHNSEINGALTITNQTTGQRLRLSASPGLTQWYVCNSKNGNCYFDDGSGTKTANYVYHDYGFIQLAPADFAFTCEYLRDINNPHKIYVNDPEKRLAGVDLYHKYFALNPTSRYLIQGFKYDVNTIELTFQTSGTSFATGGTGVIYSGANIINIDPDVRMINGSVQFEYKPTFN